VHKVSYGKHKGEFTNPASQTNLMFGLEVKGDAALNNIASDLK